MNQLSSRTLRRLAALLFLSPAALASCGGHNGSGGDSSHGTSASSSPCATRSGMRGKTTRTLTVGGTQRTYVAYLPQALDANDAAPLVLVFHGAAMNGEEMYEITGYSGLADTAKFAVAFADGQDTNSSTGASTLDPWSVSDDGAQVCGAGNLANNPDAVDFAFIDAIKADLLQDQCVDDSHVFATGFSMGGYFTHHIGCDRTDVRAIAPSSGGTIASLDACATAHVPAIIFHGAADPLIAPGCDLPTSSMQSGFPPTAQLWAQKNGCGTTYSPVADAGGGGAAQCYLYDGCPSDGQVEFCSFPNMGHCWAGGDASGSGSAYACPNYASATQLTWSFWQQYAW